MKSINGIELCITNLCKSYKKQEILKDFNLRLGAGQTIGLSGVNGSGKSTMIRILALVESADSGNIFMDGKDAVKHKSEYKKYIGYAPQDTALFEELTVIDNFHYFCLMNSKKAKSNIDDLIEAFDMIEFIHKRVEKLSGGMKKRVNLAVALLNEPRILIADEPFVGLDAYQRNRVIEYLRLLSEKGLTQIISSHYIENIDSFASSIFKFTQ